MKIYSIGTSNRSIEEFMGILKAYGVEVATDVRSFPQSRFPHFEQAELAHLLRKGGIIYAYLGEELGGYRREGYESYMGTLSYSQGVERLEEIAKGKTTAFFCAERLTWRCHRRFIGSTLKQRGWEVVHIVEEGKIWHPRTCATIGSGGGKD